MPLIVNGDAATTTEDGAPVVIPVLSNDTSAVSVARVNGVSVTPGSVIILQSGARVLVNLDGTLSYQIGAAFQGLGAGQTAQETFTYAALGAGRSAVAPQGVFDLAGMSAASGLVITGANAGDRSGYSVAGIGDVNGDGIDDILIGALSADPSGRTDAGVSYVVFGRQGGFGQTLDLASLPATAGFALTGVNAFDYSGASVSRAGDVNGDGRADFLIGAPWGELSTGANAGETYLVFGSATQNGPLDLSALNGTNGLVFRGAAAGDGLGFAVAAAGDINGDGIGDLIIGAREADGAGGVDIGASYVVFGQRGGLGSAIDVTSLTGATGFSITGPSGAARSGYSVAAAGDVNGDGIGDLIIGAPRSDPGGRTDAGEAFVVFGRRGGFGSTVDLGALTGANGFSISGMNAGDYAGWSVSSAGDLNGDGLADIVVGALYADVAGRENAGETYVIYGRIGGFGASFSRATLTGATGFVITGTAALNLTGHSVASAGDVNGDGIDDLLIGAIYADPSGRTDAGESYVVFGRAGGFGATLDLASLDGMNGFAIGGAAAGDFSGQSVSAAGDVNGDGIDDLIIGAPMADPSGRTNAGASYILFGARNVRDISGPATVTVTVNGVNDRPVITSNGGGATGGYAIFEGTLGPNTVSATDADTGAQQTYSIIGGADAALFMIDPQTGVLSLRNAQNFEAPADQNADNRYEVIVQASDGQEADSQLIVVTMLDANEAPVITSNGGGPSAAVSAPENGVAVTVVTAFDPDAGATQTYSIIGGADAGRFTINAANGQLNFVNAPNFEAPTDQNGDGVYDVTVQVSDGQNTDSQTLAVSVTNVNEAPAITSNGGGATGGYAIFEGTFGPNTVSATDPDAGTQLTYSIIGGADAALFVVDPQSGVLRLRNTQNFEAPADQNADNRYEVVVQASDGQASDSQLIVVTMLDANEAPAITSNGGGPSAAVSAPENGVAVTVVTASDPDAGATQTYSIIGGADAGRFTINAANGQLNFVTAPDREAPTDQNSDGVYDVVVQVSDGQNTDSQTLAVTVTNVNESPVITSAGGGDSGSVTVKERTLNVTNTAFDPDAGTTLTFSIIGGDDAGAFSIDPNTGTLTFLQSPDFESPGDQTRDNIYDVVIQVSDGQLTDTQTLSVIVTDIAESDPVITSNGGGEFAFVIGREGDVFVTTVKASDNDAGETLTYSIVGGLDADQFTIDPVTGALNFVNPPSSQNPTDDDGDGVYDVVVQVSDGQLTDTQSLSVNLGGQSPRPIMSSKAPADGIQVCFEPASSAAEAEDGEAFFDFGEPQAPAQPTFEDWEDLGPSTPLTQPVEPMAEADYLTWDIASRPMCDDGYFLAS